MYPLFYFFATDTAKLVCFVGVSCYAELISKKLRQMRGEQMLLEVVFSNGEIAHPAFDPAHAEGVSAFYNELARIGFVKSWKVI